MSLRNKPGAIALVATAIVASIVRWAPARAQKPQTKKRNRLINKRLR